MSLNFESFLNWLDEDPLRYLNFITVRTNQTKPMTKDKYAYAMEMLSAINAGQETEWKIATGEWESDKEPQNTCLDILNDPNRYRVKETPGNVPFGPEDITSDMWFKHKSSDDCWNKPESISGKWVSFSDSPHWTYEQLRDNFVYRRDGWVEKTAKCEKCNTSTPPPKREPRRVWVNFAGGEIAAYHNPYYAKNVAGSLCSEVAVEFVEVVKS